MSDCNSNVTRNKKKLVLHFDIRNTMIVADSVTNITVEQALNAYLTSVLWGQETENMEWVWSSDAPHLHQIEKGTIQYYKHLEKIIVKTPPDRTKLRLAVGDFVHTGMGHQFKSYYDDHLRLLRWNHNFVDSNLTLVNEEGQHYHYILPAIYQLIEKLEKDGRDFNIIIRTYGLDCENVLSSLNHCLTTKTHPDYPNLPNMELYPHAGRIIRQGNTILLQGMKKGQVVKEITDEDAIYDYFCSVKGVQGFRDDFLDWQQHNYHHSRAKPLWIDPLDSEHHHILFDDNFRSGAPDSIVDIRERQAGKWISLDSAGVSKYDNISLIQVDLLEAIADKNYYVNKVEQCELKHSAYVNEFRTHSKQQASNSFQTLNP